MEVNQMLVQTGAAEAISRELGVDPGTAHAGASALLPLILSGFKNPVAPHRVHSRRLAALADCLERSAG